MPRGCPLSSDTMQVIQVNNENRKTAREIEEEIKNIEYLQKLAKERGQKAGEFEVNFEGLKKYLKEQLANFTLEKAKKEKDEKVSEQ